MTQQALAGKFFTEARESTYKEGDGNDAQKHAKALTRKKTATLHRGTRKHIE
jgi:hypothetical protein